MRNDKSVGSFRHMHDFAPDGESAATSQVRLQNIYPTLFDESLKAPLSCFLFTAGNQAVRAFGKLVVTGIILRMEEFLQKIGTKLFQGICQLKRFFRGSFDEPASIYH